MDAQRLQAAKLAARHELWRRGDLAWKLDRSKLAIHAEIEALPPHGQYVIEACRKLGKSFLFVLIATETAIRTPGARINYATPTAKLASEVVCPIFQELIADAPPDCRPTYSAQTGHWTFPNGSYVVLGGAEDEAKADRLRGPTAILSIVDEAGFISVLGYCLESVLSPQHLRTGGRTLVGSTPPKSPGHDFCRVADAAMRAGQYAHRDIYSEGIDGIPDPEAFIAQRAAAKGMTRDEFIATTDFRREYLALRVTDADSAVVPEFQALESTIVKEWPRPPYWDGYVAVDLGFTRDLSGGVFGFYDFRAATLVIEDEFLLKRATTRDIGEAIIAKEAALWPDHPPYLRVIDDPGRMTADLYDQCKLICSPARKGDREAGINGLRVMVQNRKLVINPRCRQLIHQLRTAVFNRAGKDLDRNETDGHYDLLAALVILIKSLVTGRNPYPDNWNVGPGQYRTGAHWASRVQVNPYAEAALSGSRFGRRILKKSSR